LRRIKVLLVEDSEDDVLLILRSLERNGFAPDATVVSNAPEMKCALETGDWDVILCDYKMPGFSAEAAFDMVRESGRDLPFIIVSGTIADAVAVELMRRGVHDYIMKDNLARLAPVIRREIAEAEERRRKREAEAALGASEQRYRTLVRSIIDSIIVTDPDGKVSELYAKGHLLKTEGCGPGAPLDCMLPENLAARLVKTIGEVANSGHPASFEFSYVRGDERAWIHVSVSPHEDGRRVVSVLRDVSSVRRTEQLLEAADRRASLYLDLMGHDIRNYLQAIMIDAELIDEAASDDEVHKLVDGIRSTVMRCADLISSVQMMHESGGSLQELDLSGVLLDTMAEFARKYPNATVESRVATGPAVIRADGLLKTLFLNILENAVAHNPRSNPTIWVSLRATQEGFEVEISDNGTGIPDALKSRLFSPGSRLGGMGLNQVRDIAERYGARFEISDRVAGDPSQGTCCTIQFPRAHAT